MKLEEEYTVKGVLMDKSAEKTLLVNGEEVTAETTFVPETTDGTVDVTLLRRNRTGRYLTGSV